MKTYMGKVIHNEFADDCIHLKACRRLQKIADKQGKRVARRCNSESCTAYQSQSSFYTAEDVYRVIHGMEEEYGLSYGDNLIEDYLYY